MNCAICRKKLTIWNLPAFVPTIIHPITGEKYSFCTKCAPRLIRSGATISQDSIIKMGGLHPWIHLLHKKGILSIEEYNFVLEDDVRIIAQKHNVTPTGWIPYTSNIIIVDENHSKIIINNKLYAFGDIVGYEVLDNSINYQNTAPETTNYNTKTNNGLTRSIVGGVLAGPAGAVMGGLTSKHSLSITNSGTSEYNYTVHDYSIIIKTKRISTPSEVINLGNEANELHMLSNLLDNLLQYNSDNK